jgi:hypothetical protein
MQRCYRSASGRSRFPSMVRRASTRRSRE